MVQLGDTVQVGRLTFTVSHIAEQKDGLQYFVTGKRGAQYATMRNARDTTKLFFVSTSATLPLKGTWLTDASGKLEAL
jgi:hypothetical protein